MKKKDKFSHDMAHCIVDGFYHVTIPHETFPPVRHCLLLKPARICPVCQSVCQSVLLPVFLHHLLLKAAYVCLVHQSVLLPVAMHAAKKVYEKNRPTPFILIDETCELVMLIQNVKVNILVICFSEVLISKKKLPKIPYLKESNQFSN